MTLPPQVIRDFIASLPGLDSLHAPNADFYYFDPRRDTPHDKRQPFATLVTADDYGTVSNLSRPGVYRLNVGVSRESYRSLFGPEPAWGKDGGPVDTGHDFSALDAFLPHPIYAPMDWICILCPSETNWGRVQGYIREAHALAARRHERRGAAAR